MQPQVISFGPCQIAFDHRVLEPRPWTVMQSAWAVELSPEAGPGSVLELCCGAGQIGLAAAVWSERSLVQVDLNPTACDFARANATAAGIGDRVDVRCATIDESVRVNEAFPIILVDPPYLPSAMTPRFPNDPRASIDGGTDGLELARSCLPVINGAMAIDGVTLLQLAGIQQFHKLESELPDGLALEEVREVDSERAVGLIRHRSG
ncbi:MAG: methyltransferase [Microthrixaceae bacterium]